MLGWEIDVHGGSSQALTGEIGLSEIQNVFAEVSICPGTVKLLQKSLRETHFEATATCFEFFPGFTKFSQDRTETRIKLKVQGGLFARLPAKPFSFAPPLGPPGNFTFMAGPRRS